MQITGMILVSLFWLVVVVWWGRKTGLYDNNKPD